MPKKPQQQLAKLSRPRLHKAVQRERLFALLDDAREHKPAICVVGPPGAGKTTLVASWLDARSIKGIWYQVDSGDADLATFFYYLGEAAKSLARKGQRPLPLLTPEYLQDVEGFSRRFFRELFSRLPEGATLVLDNYQEVGPDERFHEIVAQAVDEVPAEDTLIVVSRRDAPDCYARLFANENVAFLDWEDLKLAFNEAQQIAEARGGIDRETIRTLYQSTGGWAAGLVLALEHRRRGMSVADLDQVTQEAIFTYFASQIFDRVEQSTRQVLMKTAFLPQVRVTVAKALTGNENAADVLEELYRRHLFTHRKPGHEPIYWYHALFQNFLRKQAERHLPAAELRALKLSAARLLEKHEEAGAAVALYSEIEEWDEAARVALAEAPKLVEQGRGQTLRDWAARLPLAVTHARPWLGYWLGISLTPIDQEAAKAKFARSFELFEAEADRTGQLLCSVGCIEAIFLEQTDHRQMDPWIERLENLLIEQPVWPSPDTELRAYSAALIAFLYRRTTGSTRLQQYADRVFALLDSTAGANQRMMAATNLMLFCGYTGKLDTGRLVLRLGSVIALFPEVSPHNKAMWFVWAGYYQMIASTYEASRQALQSAHELCASHGLRSILFLAHYMLANLESGHGRLEEAERHRDALDTVCDASHRIQVGGRAGVGGWNAVHAGQASRAIDCGRMAIEAARQLGSPSYLIYWGTPLLYGLIETRQWGEANRLLEEIRAAAAGAFPYFEPIAECALARMEMLQGNESQARERVFAAFERAEQSGYGGYLAWMRPWMPPFCAWLLEAGVAQPFVRALIARKHWNPPSEWIEAWPWPIKVRTFGEFRIEIDGNPLSFSRKAPKKPIALLKAIISFGGKSVPEQKLIDALWPDEDGDAAREAFAVSLHRLRKLLVHPDVVQLSEGLISIDPKKCWVDAWALEHRISSYDRSTDSVSLGGADPVWRLYRGHFLAEDMEAPWTLSMRERLRGQFLRHVSRTGRQQEDACKLDVAVLLYQKGIEADDLAEELYQGLMRSLNGLGRRAEAMAVFRRLRQTLSVTLGISPSPPTERLFQTIQRED